MSRFVRYAALITAIVAVAGMVFSTSVAAAGASFTTFGNATVGPDGVTAIADSSASAPYGGVSFTLPPNGVTLGQITYLGTEYTANAGTCHEGSPRFSLITPNGNIFVYIGDASSSFQSCAQSADTGNLLTSGDTRCDNSQLVGHYSVVDCASLDPNISITEIDLVVDAPYQSFTFNPTVEFAPPTSKDQCKNGGYAAYGYKNQGQCIKFVNTGS